MNGEVNKTVAILQAKQIAKTYGNKQTEQEVLKDIDLSIEAGEFVAIMGPSGSGKTTLLNVLSSIDYLTHGSIILDGQQLEKLSNKALSEIRKKDIGFIFQEYNLLHTLTVKENIMLPLSVQKLDKKEMNERYQRITQALNIFEISDKYPSDISGGRRQRTSRRVHLLRILRLFSRMSQQGHLILKILAIYYNVFKKSMNFITQR